jgi:hypothetical protein
MVPGYNKSYKHDPRVNLIIKTTDKNTLLNNLEKDRFQNLIQSASHNLLKNYKSQGVQKTERTMAFMKIVSETLNGHAFTQFLKHI